MAGEMGDNPYLITGPALISFSGGRTSAYMLYQILQAHGGKLPDDVVVAFANTGKEREETLRFVHECSVRWGVSIVWLEFWARSGEPRMRYAVVGYNSASRKGEPFARLVAAKKFTPNSMARFCTEELKLNTINGYLRHDLGWTNWLNVVGIGHDEGRRCLKAYARNDEGATSYRTVLPLDKARVTRQDVDAFWCQQPFKLALRSYEGNCDLCFLKSRGALKAIMREQPGAADWWVAQEAIGKGRFVTEYSYADLAREVAEQPHLFDELLGEEHDAECGLWCGADDAFQIPWGALTGGRADG